MSIHAHKNYMMYEMYDNNENEKVDDINDDDNNNNIYCSTQSYYNYHL